jgi:hypothetical protein
MEINTTNEEDFDINQFNLLSRSSPDDHFCGIDVDLAQFSYIFDTNDEPIRNSTEAEPLPSSTLAGNSRASVFSGAHNVTETINLQPPENVKLFDHQDHLNGLASLGIPAQAEHSLDYGSTPYSFTPQQVAALNNGALRWPVQGRVRNYNETRHDLGCIY